MGISGRLFNLLFGASKDLATARPGSEGRGDGLIGGSFQVLNRMGLGGTAMVLRAFDRVLQREVALKVLLEAGATTDELTQRFLAEGRILASIHHPNVVMVYSIGVDEAFRVPFLVMEMIHGNTFEDHADEFRRNPLHLFREMITVMEAIHFCHQKNVIHLDLKPSNIMVDQTGRAKVIDFGIAYAGRNPGTSAFAVGTAVYMAPEQFSGQQLTGKADVYAFGIMLWEFSTGAPPFAADPGSRDPFLDLAALHREAPLPLDRLAVSPAAVSLTQLIESMLAKDPAQRPELPQIIKRLREELVAQGARIGQRYEVLEVPRRRGAFNCYKTRDQLANRTVAIEMLSPDMAADAVATTRFLERAGKFAHVESPFLPTLHAIERESSTRLPFLVLEWFDGQPLTALSPYFRARPERLFPIFVRVFQGLAACHAAGFPHGNLVSESILVNENDDVKLTGFDFLANPVQAIETDIVALGGLLTDVLLPYLTADDTGQCLSAGCHELQTLASRMRDGSRVGASPIGEHAAAFARLQEGCCAALALLPHVPQTALGRSPREKLATLAQIEKASRPGGIKVLLDALAEETEPAIIAAILPLLARLERRSELPWALTFLDHADASVRTAAVEAIRVSGEIGLCLQLFERLSDVDGKVRHHVAAALKHLGDDRLRDQLQTFALFGLPDQQVSAVRALRYYPSDEHLMMLNLLERSGTADVADAARETTLHFLTRGLTDLASSAAEPVLSNRLEAMEDHAIVCGLGRKGRILVESLMQTGQDCVVIESNADPAAMKSCHEADIPLLRGSASHAPLLLAAGVARARYLLAVTGDDDENLEIALKAKMLLGNVSRSPYLPPLQCLCHVVSHRLQRMADLFQPGIKGARSRFEGLTASPVFELRLFNLFTNAARLILGEHAPQSKSLAAQARGDPLHILILGFSRLGVSLAAHVAGMFQGPDAGLLQLTVVDTPEQFKQARFHYHYPKIDQALALNFVPSLPADINRQFLDRLAAVTRFSAVYVCHEDPEIARSLAEIAMGLDSLAERAPVVVLDWRKFSLLRDMDAPGIDVFSFYPSTGSIKAIVQEPLDKLARALHRHYAEEQRRSGIAPGSDPVRAIWERLRGDLKERFRVEADHLPVKLRTIGCRLAPNTGPGKRHDLAHDEIILLAQIEHRRRVVGLLLSQWQPAVAIDSLQPPTSGIPGWSSLSAVERDELAAGVARIPDVLELIGHHVERE